MPACRMCWSLKQCVEEAPRPRAFQAFAPEVINGRLKVQPLLTPDNYPEVIANLIGQRQRTRLIENQSFNSLEDIEDSTPSIS